MMIIMIHNDLVVRNVLLKFDCWLLSEFLDRGGFNGERGNRNNGERGARNGGFNGERGSRNGGFQSNRDRENDGDTGRRGGQRGGND